MKTINIKEKSIKSFVSENSFEPVTKMWNAKYRQISVLFKKDSNILIGDKIRLQITDHTQYSSINFLVTYIYDVVEYDDVANEVILVDTEAERVIDE